jgi:hypothetical protein
MNIIQMQNWHRRLHNTVSISHTLPTSSSWPSKFTHIPPHSSHQCLFLSPPSGAYSLSAASLEALVVVCLCRCLFNLVQLSHCICPSILISSRALGVDFPPPSCFQARYLLPRPRSIHIYSYFYLDNSSYLCFFFFLYWCVLCVGELSCGSPLVAWSGSVVVSVPALS